MDAISRLLVLSKDAGFRKALGGHLPAARYQITFSENAEDASAETVKHEIDLALVDARLPALDLEKLIVQLNESRPGAWIPVILASGQADDRTRGAEAGCVDILSLPLDKDELQAKVETVIRISRSRSLLEEKAKFDNVLDSLADGIVILDLEFEIKRSNLQARNYLGLNTGQAGAHLMRRLRTLFEIRYPGALEADMRTQPLTFDIERLETADTRPLILELRTNVVRDLFRQITGITAVMTDVTEKRKKAYQEEQFLNFISHKLRTPLAIVQKNATMFHEKVLGPLNADQEKFMNALYEKSCELVDSFEKLLGFTMIKSRRLDLPEGPILLAQYLPELLQVMTKRLRGKKFEWKVECPDAALSVKISKKYLEMMLNNLIENAVKFAGQDQARVLLKVAASGDQVEITVEDNGPGIPPEETERIFEPFYQIDKHRTLNVAGTGLGLAIVKHLVTVAGGQIRVVKTPAGASAFQFTLPSGR